MKLHLAPLNEKLLIEKVNEKYQKELKPHGIFPGEIIKVLSNSPWQPLRIQVRNCFMALDKEMAPHITVQVKKP